MDYRGRRVTIMGLGHFGGGVAAARWLARQGAIVTVTDLADEDALADSLPLLADVPIAAVHLGGHREEDFRGADLVVVNPAVRPEQPVAATRPPITLPDCAPRLELFMENCPAPIIGVTGSNGKSTTAAMIASILNCGAGVPPALAGAGETPAPRRRTFLGGNIGVSLLDQLPQIGRDDWVVLEISSFQLWHFTPAARMPQVAVITGCTPNHLDWHASFADYVAAKQRILTGQTPADFAVLNTCDAEVASWSHLVRGRQMPLPSPPAPLPQAGEGRCEVAALARAGRAQPNQRRLCGRGGDGGRVRAGGDSARAWSSFIPCRSGWNGSRWSRAADSTTIRRPPRPSRPSPPCGRWTCRFGCWPGARARGSISSRWPPRSCDRARGAAFFGAAGPELRRRVAAKRPQFPCIAVETMEEALRWCWPRSRPGEAIVLSPACASTDQFRNFQQRGASGSWNWCDHLTRNGTML